MSKTLEGVLIDMVMVRGGTDRGALVRPAQKGKEAAVCVIMTSKQAVRQLGKPLVNIARKLGDGSTGFGTFEITEKIDLVALFEIVDSAPTGWCYGSFQYYKLTVVLAIFCRSLDAVAMVCNDHGAPCSFDSNKPAAGWQIDEVLDRRS